MRADGRRPDAAQVADDIVGRGFGQIAADAQHQRGIRRHARFAAEREIQQAEADDRDEERDAEHREENGESPFSHNKPALQSGREWGADA